VLQGFFESRGELANSLRLEFVIAFILDQRHDLDSILAVFQPGSSLNAG